MTDQEETKSEETTLDDSDDLTAVEIGRKLFSLRDYTPVPLIVILLFVAEPNVLSSTIGILFIVCGELIRIYSVAFIGSVSRTRSNSTGESVITSGPFKYVRNPLYVGNFLITMGIAIFSGIIWFALLSAALFCVQYFYIVKYEEHNLLGKFGGEFKDYLSRVPPWIPKEKIKLSELDWPDSFGDAIKSEKRTLSAIAILVLALVLISI